MESTDLKHVRNSVMVLAACIAFLAAMMLLITDKASVFSVVFLFLDFVFMSAHWWLLSLFVAGLIGTAKPMMALLGMLMLFPLMLSLAVVFVAGKINVAMILPSAVGLLAVPVAAVCYGLVAGLVGCLRPAHEKGLSS